MSAGPQLQLAVLWPWLLMATLQAGLGHTGLALAAAVESERAAAQKAIIRVIPLKVEPIILEGEFANVAEVTPAEGKLLQGSKKGETILALAFSNLSFKILLLKSHFVTAAVMYFFPVEMSREKPKIIPSCVLIQTGVR
ncbi:hypothetical protein BTVI_44324 [Pitangus sulphuratus]|nr:hypothetical protein BTVI_44324 [Pitangus sulphuratus]